MGPGAGSGFSTRRSDLFRHHFVQVLATTCWGDPPLVEFLLSRRRLRGGPPGRLRVVGSVVVVALKQRPAVASTTAPGPQVAAWLAEGRTVREIAISTGRKEKSVYWHLEQIYAKRGISRQADLVRLVLSVAEFTSRNAGARSKSGPWFSILHQGLGGSADSRPFVDPERRARGGVAPPSFCVQWLHGLNRALGRQAAGSASGTGWSVWTTT